MDFRQRISSREWGLGNELLAAFNSSDDVAKVFARAQGALLQLLEADALALCLSKPGRVIDYTWLVSRLPAELLAHYPEKAEGDFVRHSLVRRPNQVLSDREMVPREVLERSEFYRYSRELGTPLEHVLAVMVEVDPRWHGGVTLYRARPRPFSEWEQALLRWAQPWLSDMLCRCKQAEEVALRERLLEAARRRQGVELLQVFPPSTEEWRTDGATALLDAWFPSTEREPSSGLPSVLLKQLALLERASGGERSSLSVWSRREDDRTLRVTFIELEPRPNGQRPWALLLQSVPHGIPLPQEWRQRLKPAEAEAVNYALRGWDNKLIAGHRSCEVSTVKTLLYRAYNELGVDDRVSLILKAFRW